MSTFSKFLERETGVVVDVETVFAWDPYPKINVVTFPSGKRYGISDDEMHLYFEIVTPQEVVIAKAFGAIDERPTAKQRKAYEAANARAASVAESQEICL